MSSDFLIFYAQPPDLDWMWNVGYTCSMDKHPKAILMAVILISTAVSAFAETTNIQPLKKSKDRANRAMNFLLSGPIDAPPSQYESRDRPPSPDSGCQKSARGAEHGIAGLIDGVWQIATFWCSEQECSKTADSASANASSAR